MTDVIEATDMPALRSAWQRVFSTSDAFVWPFNHDVEAFRIFYPTDGYHLTREQYSAMTAAFLGTSKGRFFLSIVESEGLSFLDRTWGHWACDVPSYEEYSELPLTLENALYSMDGNWGILVSHEMHALIGGTAPFVAILDEQYQGWANDLRLLREAWLGNPNAAWLEPIIARTA